MISRLLISSVFILSGGIFFDVYASCYLGGGYERFLSEIEQQIDSERQKDDFADGFSEEDVADIEECLDSIKSSKNIITKMKIQKDQKTLEDLTSELDEKRKKLLSNRFFIKIRKKSDKVQYLDPTKKDPSELMVSTTVSHRTKKKKIPKNKKQELEIVSLPSNSKESKSDLTAPECFDN